MSRPVRITEVSTMARCEKQWHYRYVRGMEDPPSKAMAKGTLIHAIYAAWWKAGGIHTGITSLGAKAIHDEIDPDKLAEVEALPQAEKDDAAWLMDRYMQVYAPNNPFRQVWSERELEATVGGVVLQGKGDGLVEHVETGKLYLQECKSMKDWRRLDILDVDPQMTHYYLMLREMGYDIFGIMYDAIKTYRWKRDVHPPEDSVRRVFIDRTDEQCGASLDEIRAFDERRDDIESGRRLPLRNISSYGSCSSCNFRPDCWEELAFPETQFSWED